MLYCIKHQYYRGTDAPSLKCLICCKIFIAEKKRQNIMTSASPNLYNNSLVRDDKSQEIMAKNKSNKPNPRP